MKLKNFTFVLAVAMIVGLAVYGIYWNVQAHKPVETDDTAYSRAFNELLENLEDAENYLLKAMASGSSENASMMLDEVWRCASLAESHLEVLPVDQSVMAKVSKYIVQLADVSKAFNEKSVYRDELTEEETELLGKMYGYAQDINGAFQYMASALGSGNCNWSDIEKYSGVITDNEEIAEGYEFLGNFSEPVEDYPTLIYDGPFSEHMQNVSPKGIAGEDITKEQGVERLAAYLQGYDILSCELAYENNNSNIRTYSYVVTLKNNTVGEKELVAYGDITVQGGLLSSFIMYREIGEENLTAEQAVEQGATYLAAVGFEDMKPSYYSVQGGVVTANYCYEKDAVLYYPDMIKVSVALDTGEVTGVEAGRYILNHCVRELPAPELSPEEARKLLSSRLVLESERLAVIPNDFGGEHFVYEFSASLDGRQCLVYIDCENGREREILILQENEYGILVK